MVNVSHFSHNKSNRYQEFMSQRVLFLRGINQRQKIIQVKIEDKETLKKIDNFFILTANF